MEGEDYKEVRIWVCRAVKSKSSEGMKDSRDRDIQIAKSNMEERKSPVWRHRTPSYGEARTGGSQVWGQHALPDPISKEEKEKDESIKKKSNQHNKALNKVI